MAVNLKSAIVAAAFVLWSQPALADTGFDVETASRAYLNLLQGAARAKSDSYFEGGYWLILWGAMVAILSDGLLLRFGWSARMRNWATKITQKPFRITFLTAFLYSLWGFAVALPWMIYTGFLREQQYDLMNQTFGGWLFDALKGMAIAVVLTPLLIASIYAVIRRFDRNWWVLGTAVVTAFVFIGVALTPVYIAPLFNKYTELPAGPARDRIVAMAQSNHIPTQHIYVYDASRQTKKISANVSGIGPTIRISLNDNLLNRTSLSETAAVVGHEMGHYVLGHIWKIVAMLTLMTAAALFLISRIVPAVIARYGERWGIRNIADPASMPVLGITLSVLGLLATPLLNTLTRYQESQADAFGLVTAREPDGFALTAIKLAEYRKLEPSPLEEAVFYDHPSGATRVRMAMQWKKDNVPGAQMIVPAPLVPDAPASAKPAAR